MTSRVGASMERKSSDDASYEVTNRRSNGCVRDVFNGRKKDRTFFQIVALRMKRTGDLVSFHLYL